MSEIKNLHLEPIIDRALEESWGKRDWATGLCISDDNMSRACICASQDVLLSGMEVMTSVFRRVDPKIEFQLLANDGDFVQNGHKIFFAKGHTRSLLKAERVALQFLQRMSGIAKTTSLFVEALTGFHTQILDCRKHTPGMRLLEKQATYTGGAKNHRLCMTEGVLVSESQIQACGSITNAVNALLESLAPTLKIEVIARNLDDVHEALDAGADLILLDSMSVSEMALTVRTVRGRVLLEATGNIPLSQIRTVAETGVDFISSDQIIHSSPWASFVFQIEKESSEST